MEVEPSPRTWTLRFKHNRSTILLEVDPLQKMSLVREELLQALNETNASGTINGLRIPPNPDHIKLGRAVDRNNLTLGYTSIDNEFDDSGAGSGKGKGKSAVGTTSGKAKASANGVNDCPQGAGFRNGDVVAFKFANGDDDEPEDEDDVAEKWDVVVPTLEDTYGDDGEAQEEG